MSGEMKQELVDKANPERVWPDRKQNPPLLLVVKQMIQTRWRLKQL
jgi:hypothetical protein